MPTPTPRIKIAAKANKTIGVKLKPDEGLEFGDVSLGAVNLDLRFIVAQSTLREWI
ncbi:MAG: hypothetical protein Fur006_49170 [Coleofasciculaceae cyanobacterium]